MRERIQRFMMGRYGNDQLNQCLMLIATICIVLDMFTHISLFFILALVLLVLTYVRIFSRDVNRRYAENMKFLEKKDAILNRFRREKYYASQRKDFHIYTCPQCRQKIRIPRGKGRINVTCPKCRTSFIKKS